MLVPGLLPFTNPLRTHLPFPDGLLASRRVSGEVKDANTMQKNQNSSLFACSVMKHRWEKKILKSYGDATLTGGGWNFFFCGQARTNCDSLPSKEGWNKVIASGHWEHGSYIYSAWPVIWKSILDSQGNPLLPWKYNSRTWQQPSLFL